MSDPADEGDLIERARSGDRAAVEDLLARHEGQVYRFGLKMCRDAEDAKDVLQETLLAAARGLRDFRGESSLSTWLFTIARSQCARRRRKAERGATQAPVGGEAEAALEAVDPGLLPDERAEGRELGGELEVAILALEPSYREVLLLRDVEGLTAPEVAAALGISVEAVKSRLHRARLAVRARMAPLLGLPELRAPREGTCPEVVAIFSRHLEGEIDADTCAEMERHVQACARCRGACDSLRQTLAMCSATRTATVPPEVQRAVRSALHQALASLGPA